MVKKRAEEYEVYRNIAIRKRNYSLGLSETCASKFDAFLHKAMDKLELNMPKFEKRESQQIMMKEIYTALRDSRFSLIEAGTGTGRRCVFTSKYLFRKEKRRTCHYKYTNCTIATTNTRKRNSVITENNAIFI